MEHKTGGRPRESVGNQVEDFVDETGLPVIELIDVVEEDSGGASLSGDRPFSGGVDPDASILEKDMHSALEEALADREIPGIGNGKKAVADEIEFPAQDFNDLTGNGEEEFIFTFADDDSAAAGLEGSVSLNEQRLELMISRIVEDAVTRVTRETVAQVTEKVLTAAIEAIRDNLPNPPR